MMITHEMQVERYGAQREVMVAADVQLVNGRLVIADLEAGDLGTGTSIELTPEELTAARAMLAYRAGVQMAAALLKKK